MQAPLDSARDISYTTPRPDVSAMVPAAALRILDVGCSNGALGASLKGERPGRFVAGIERDPGYSREAEARLDRVICADLNEFDWSANFQGDRFDCVIFADVLEHLPDPAAQLRQARELLSEAGVVVVSLPNIRHMSALYSIFMRGTFPRRPRGIFDSTHLRWFTIADAMDLLKSAGFGVQSVTYSLRVGDQGGGFLNKLVDRLLTPVSGLFPVREFLTYQFCVRASRAK